MSDNQPHSPHVPHAPQLEQLMTGIEQQQCPPSLYNTIEPTEIYVLPCDGEDPNDSDVDMALETTSIGRMEREPLSDDSNDDDDDDSDDSSSMSSDFTSSDDEDPLDLFSNQDMLNLVFDMMADADNNDDSMMSSPFGLQTANEISDEFVSIDKVDNLILPSQEYLDQLAPGQPLIAGLEPLGTIMNIFSHKVILKPHGAKSSIFTDSSDDDDNDSDNDSDDDFDKQNLRNFGNNNNNHNNNNNITRPTKSKVQKPNPAAVGTISTTDALARLTTLKLQTPIFNNRGEGVGRLSDIIGHVEFPFFIVSYHNQIKTTTDNDTCKTDNNTAPNNATTTTPTNPDDNTTNTDTTTSTDNHTTLDNNNNNNDNNNNNNNNDNTNDETITVIPGPVQKSPQNQSNNNKKGKKGNKSDNTIQNKTVEYHPIPSLTNGQTLYFLPSLTTSVPTQALIGRATDASNVFDEEVSEDEQEYSDDEMERKMKKKKNLAKSNNNNNNNNNNKNFAPNQSLSHQNGRKNNQMGGNKGQSSYQNNNTHNKNYINNNNNNNFNNTNPNRNQSNSYNQQYQPQNRGPIDLCTPSQPIQTQYVPPPPPPPPMGSMPPPPPPQAPTISPNHYQSAQPIQSTPQQQQQQHQPPHQQPIQSATNMYFPMQNAPQNPYGNQYQQQQRQQQQQHDDPSYQNNVLFNQYQVLVQSGIPLTPAQTSHYQQLMMYFNAVQHQQQQ